MDHLPSDNTDECKHAVINYYREYSDQKAHPKRDQSAIEFARTLDIVQKYLPKPPAMVMDVGIGPGSAFYMYWPETGVGN